MQLKTLFSKVVLKKDLTRFMPAMALYAVFLLLLFFLLFLLLVLFLHLH